MNWRVRSRGGDQSKVLNDPDPELPDELSDRAQDNWRPLVAIADAISADIGKRARAAAKVLVKEQAEFAEEDHGIELLGDIVEVLDEHFAGKTFVDTAELLPKLLALTDKPWKTWSRGQELTERGLSSLLKPYGCHPHKHRQGKGRRRRGYMVAPIREAARYYVPQAEEQGDLPLADETELQPDVCTSEGGDDDIPF